MIVPLRPGGAWIKALTYQAVVVPGLLQAGSGLSSQREKEAQLANGTVKWFNPTRGYGFIQPDEGGKDVFVHVSAVERAGLRTLNDGQRVSYELATHNGRQSAANLKVVA